MKKILQFSMAFALLLICGKAQAQADGTLDTSFTIGTGFNAWTNTITVQTDGKTLVGGVFSSFNGQTVNRIARLNTDGTLDTSLNIGTGFNQGVWAIAIQSDGKILAGGQFTSYNGQTVNRIARLNTDGTLDTSFTIGTGFNQQVRTIALQPDGRILVGGNFTSYNGQTVNRIARLNTDGTLDTSFTIGTGFSGGFATSSSAIVLQSDGKILVVGEFTSYNGQTVNHIARLNPDGSLDTSFNTNGTGFSNTSDNGTEIFEITLQPNGKILVGGFFAFYNGQTANRIVRLNTDGTQDTSFNIGTGFNTGWVGTIALQPDGKILTGGGYFSSYNGQSANRIARLNPDGSFDTSFNIGTGFSASDDVVTTITLQPDGKILVGGYITSYNGQTINWIARLHNDVTMSVIDNELSKTKIYPNPVKDILYFDKEVNKVTITDLTGKVLATHSNSSQVDISGYQNGVYLITIEAENNAKETQKVVKG